MTTNTVTPHGNSHASCLLCGDTNPWSLKLAFEADESGKVSAAFQPDARFQGYAGMLHGGIIAALLDAAMTHCLLHRHVEAVTAEMRVRYLRPVPCREPCRVYAWIRSEASPLYRLEAELNGNGHTFARAEDMFVPREFVR